MNTATTVVIRATVNGFVVMPTPEIHREISPSEEWYSFEDYQAMSEFLSKFLVVRSTGNVATDYMVDDLEKKL